MKEKIHYKQKISWFGEILYHYLCGITCMDWPLWTRDFTKVTCKNCLKIGAKK